MEDQNNENIVPNNNPQNSDKDKVNTTQAHPIMDDTSQENDENKKQVENESSSEDSDLDLDLAFKCVVCTKTFSGLKPLLQHEKSAKHYKMLQKKKVDKKISQKLEDDQSDGVLEDLVPGTYAECETCKKQFSGPESYHQHLTSKVHKKKMAEVKFLENITDSGKINVEKLKEIYKQRRMIQNDITKAGAAGYSPTLEEIEDFDANIADSYQFECKECDKKFTGVSPWYQHLVSKTHEKTLKQRQLFEKLNLGRPSESSAPTENIVSKDMDSIEIDDDVLTCQLCHMSFSGPESVFDHLKSRGHAKKKEIKEWKMGHTMKSATRPAVETTSRRALDKSKVSQDVEDLGAATLPEPQITGATQLTEDLRANLATRDSVSNDGDLDSKANNPLLCHESYKEYKKIMNEIESKGQLM